MKFMTDFTIENDYVLPSEGKVYGNIEVKPNVTLRSMTTAEEMRRLNHSDRQYKLLAEIIDECITTPIGISAYDLCIADFQFLLHKLRIVTYGSNYKLKTTCQWCGCQNDSVVNMDDLNVKSFDAELFEKYSEFELPVTKDRIKLKMQTPRMIDDVKINAKDFKKKHTSFVGDPTLMLTLECLIDEINGKRPERFKLSGYIQKLPMKDTNYILKAAEKITNSFGIDSSIELECEVCGLDYDSSFRITPEFFGPSIDE